MMRADEGQTVPPGSINRNGHSPGVRGVGARLAAALAGLAHGEGALVSHRQRPWASITFTGIQHELTFRFDGPQAIEAGERLVAEVGEYEFAIPHQLVAEAAVAGVDHRTLPEPSLTVRLEVLTLDDG